MASKKQRITAAIMAFAMLLCSADIPAFSSGIGEDNYISQTICGMDEHTHTAACYTPVLTCGQEETETATQRTFHSTFQVHRHSDACRDESGKLACGMIEKAYYHTHNEYCRDEEGKTVCGLETRQPHEHTEACWQEETVLICGQEESEEHSHSEACYETSRKLICETPTTTHRHSAACFNEKGHAVCGELEIPTFTSTEENWTTETVQEGHQHSEACYTMQLICNQAEHVHTDSCYAQPTEEPIEEPTEEITEEQTEDPTETPIEESSEEPTEELTEESAETPTETPTEESSEEPTEELAEESAETTTEEPTEEPAEESADTTTEEPTEEPAEESAETTTEEPTEEPAEELTEEPAEEPTEIQTEEPTEEPTEKPVEESAETTTEEPTEDPTEEPAEEPTDGPTEGPTEETTDGPTEGLTDEPAETPTEEPIEVPAEQSITEPIPESTGDPESGNETETGDSTETETLVFETEEDTLLRYNGAEETVTIPDGIRIIGLRAFAGNRNIRKVILPDSVEIIKNYVFEECAELETVVISEQSRLETIGKGAFRNDRKLDTSFAEGINNIVDNAFECDPEEPADEAKTEEQDPEETLTEPASDEQEDDTEEEPASEEAQETPEEDQTDDSAEGETAEGDSVDPAEEPDEESTGEEPTDAEPTDEDPDGEEPEDVTIEEADGEPEEITIPTAEDAPIQVTISFPADAGIPDGTVLIVTEAGETAESAEPEEEKNAVIPAPVKLKASSAMRSDMAKSAIPEEEPHADIPSLTTWTAGEEAPEIILYHQTLDISLVADGEEIEPNPGTPVTVQVTLPGIEEGQDIEVRHITDAGSILLESTNNAGMVTFTTDSFSLFEFTSRTQQLTSRITDLTENVFHGKISGQQVETNSIDVSDVTEGLSILEAYEVTKSSDLWMTMRYFQDLALGGLENIALYTVDSGSLGAVVKENITTTDMLRFNLGDLNSFALVLDSGLRRRTAELGEVFLSGMMPKHAETAASDVREEYSEFRDDEFTITAFDISIMNGGEEYQPDDNPITVTIQDDGIAEAAEAGRKLNIWHVAADGTQEEITDFRIEDNAVIFDAAGFSDYVVTYNIEKTIEIDGNTYQITVTYDKTAEIPEGAELAVDEVSTEEYLDAAGEVLNWTDRDIVFYTKFLNISIVKDGEEIQPLTPVSVEVKLLDVRDGAEQLRVVHFDADGAEEVDSQAAADGTVVFSANSFSVYGFGNILYEVQDTENELASIRFLGFTAPAQEETREEKTNKTQEEQNGPEDEQDEQQDNYGLEEGLELIQTIPVDNSTSLWMQASLKADAALTDMESVALYNMENNTVSESPITEELSSCLIALDSGIDKLAVVKDTGYRHLTFEIIPGDRTENMPADENTGNTSKEEAEHTQESFENQIVVLDGMMPKEAGAAVTDVTEAYTDHEYPVAGQTGEDGKEETSQETTDSSGTESTDEEPARRTLAAFNITISNNGTEYQPDADHPISVEILDSRIQAGENIEIWHIRDDGTEEPVEEFTVENGKIKFISRGFSVYSIVEKEMKPYIGSGWVTLTDIDRIAEWGEEGFYLSHVGVKPQCTDKTYYLLGEQQNGIKYANNRTGIKAIELAEFDPDQAHKFYFTKTDGLGTYEFYISSNSKYVNVNNTTGNSLKLVDDINEASVFTLERTGSKWKIYGFAANGTKLYWNQNTEGQGIGAFASYTDPNDGNVAKLTLLYYIEPKEDPYELDGKTYGIMDYRTGLYGYALMSDPSGNNRLKAQSLLSRLDPMNTANTLYVSKGSDIAKWTFHYLEEDRYSLTTNIDGSEKYLKIYKNGNTNTVALADEYDDNCSFKVVPGTGENAGKIRLLNPDANLALYHANQNSYFEASNRNDAAGWVYLADDTVYDDDDFIIYTAQKASIADIKNFSPENKENEDIINEINNTDDVVIYVRVWNDAENEKKYEDYVVDHDGHLFRAYESGDVIQWVGSKVNTALWDFTEYYYEGTEDPNHYYELQNLYSGKYLVPQKDGSVLSSVPVGISLEGRQYAENYSTILSWDDIHYAFVGLKTEADSEVISHQGGNVITGFMSEAVPFYFAKVKPTTEANKLTTVATVDNQAHGITMKMIDYNNSISNSRDSVQSAFFGRDRNEAGMLSTDLKNNGYPVTTAVTGTAGKSLSDMFTDKPNNPMKMVNHLFIQSIYNESGYLEYDSTQNFAYLGDNTDFTVYNELATLEGSGNKKHGQFMPFNAIADENGYSIYPFCTTDFNTTNTFNQPLAEDNPRYGEQMYFIPKAESDYFFGMEMEAQFTQTPNGKDDWGHDIIFEFSGDDDFWFYVDGELVLDLGGVHSAMSGKINFRTGVVQSTRGNTTLYEIFRSNYEQRGLDEDTIARKLSEQFEENDEGQMVFSDYSVHSMKMFYMERGAGSSNLHMRMNLASVKPGEVLLSKEISGTESADFKYARYPFQIYYKLKDDTEYTRLTRNDAHIRVLNQRTRTPVSYAATYTPPGATTPYSDVFFLKAGETAIITFPDETEDYYVTECGVNELIYSNVFLNKNKEEDSGEELNKEPSSHGSGFWDYSTDADSVHTRPTIKFTNVVDPGAMRTLTFTKILHDENGVELTREQDNTGFSFRLYLAGAGEEIGGANNAGLTYLQKYYVKDPSGFYCVWDSANGCFVSTGINDYATLSNSNYIREAEFYTSSNGSISKIPSQYSVEIRNLLKGSRFIVEERENELPEGYTLTSYKRVEGSYVTLEEDGPVNCGEIRDSQVASMEIHNKRGWGLTVNKEWTDSSFMASHDPIYVAVFLGDSETLLSGSVREIGSSNSTYYFFNSLAPISDSSESTYQFSDYHVYEVALTNPVTDGNGNVISYAAIEKKTGTNNSIIINATPKGGERAEFTYLASYAPGTVEGSNHNVRTDTIRNTRGGGVIITKTDADDEPLQGARFTLKKGNDEIGQYTSDENGLVTIIYDYNTDEAFNLQEPVVYTLTETEAPGGYRGNPEPIEISITKDASDRIIVTTSRGENIANVTPGDADDAYIANVAVKNRPFTLKAVKIDPSAEPEDRYLEGAHFALYRQITYVNGAAKKDYYPIAGYTDMASDENGLIPSFDESIPPGTYYLSETRPPDGYDSLNSDICFTISKLGIITINSAGYSNISVGGEIIPILSETKNDVTGTYDYVLTIPNPPNDDMVKLIIEKAVSGDLGNPYEEFTFALNKVEGEGAGTQYAYTKYSDDGTTIIGTGIVTTDSGTNTFTLKHGESAEIMLPPQKDIKITENHGYYRTTWNQDGGEDHEGATIEIKMVTETHIVVTNILDAVAPTNFSSRHMPYLLLLVFGLILLILTGGAGIRKRIANSQSAGRRAHTANELASDAADHVRWRNSVWVKDPFSPCPEENRRADESPGKRGDREG